MSSAVTLDVAADQGAVPAPAAARSTAQPLVYLDSANTSQKPRPVIDAMTTFMETSYAPINRSAYRLAAEATDAYEGARTAVRRFINAPRADEVIFTKNATESLNLVAYSWGRANLRRRRRRRAHPHGAPRQHRAVAHAGQPNAASSCAGCRSPPTASSTSPTSPHCSTAPRRSASPR